MNDSDRVEDQKDNKVGERRRFLAKVLGVLAGTSLIGGAAKVLAQVGKTTASTGGQKQVAGENPFIGEIMMFAGNFAPTGYMICNGSLLSISSYAALFSVIGTYYGGDGITTFGLPDFRGRVPIHVGTGSGLKHVCPGSDGRTRDTYSFSNRNAGAQPYCLCEHIGRDFIFPLQQLPCSKQRRDRTLWFI